MVKYFLVSVVSALLLQSSAFGLTYAKDLPKEVRGALETDLVFVKTIQGSNRSKRQASIYGDVSGADYSKFFLDRIEHIGYAGELGDSVMAYVQSFNPHTLYLTTNLIKYKAPQAWRLSTLWHESRHSEVENDNWGHVRCPRGIKDTEGKPLVGPLSGKPLAGQPACDETVDGAYGATATMFGNLAKYCTNCGEKFKADAQLIFGDGVNRMIANDLRTELQEDMK